MKSIIEITKPRHDVQYVFECFASYVWTISELREYPIGFGVRFAENIKNLRKERSPILNPSYALY